MVNDGWRIADTMWRALARLLIAMPALVAVWPAFAHDIPSDVHVQAFVKPEGQRLQVLLRVPLGAMNEVDMPLRGPGNLDLRRADAALGVAAELWFADNLRLFEDDRPLPRAMVALARVSLASDRSFASWDAAMAHLRDPPIPPDTDLYWKQQHFDLLLEVPIAFALTGSALLYVLVYPVVLGSGKAVLPVLGPTAPLELLSSHAMGRGIVELRYRFGGSPA